MGKTIDAAVERARGLLNPGDLTKSLPDSVKAFIGELRTKHLMPDQSSLQDQMAAFVLYAEAIEGLSCNHPTYGLANLPPFARRTVREISDRIARQFISQRTRPLCMPVFPIEEQGFVIPLLPSIFPEPTHSYY
jgi:hypothetical protein